jgi:hypothetical protein
LWESILCSPLSGLERQCWSTYGIARVPVKFAEAHDALCTLVGDLEVTLLCMNRILIDLGSGLGHMLLLTCICANARTIGVEYYSKL